MFFSRNKTFKTDITNPNPITVFKRALSIFKDSLLLKLSIMDLPIMDTYKNKKVNKKLIREWRLWNKYVNGTMGYINVGKGISPFCVHLDDRLINLPNNTLSITGVKYDSNYRSSKSVQEINIDVSDNYKPKPDEVIYTCTEMVMNGIPFNKIEDNDGRVLVTVKDDFVTNLLSTQEIQMKTIIDLKKEMLVCIFVMCFMFYLIIGLNLGPLYIMDSLLRFIMPSSWFFKITNFVVSVTSLVIASLYMAKHTTTSLYDVLS